MTFHSKTLVDPENPPRVPRIITIEAQELSPGVPENLSRLELGRVVYEPESTDPGSLESLKEFATELADALAVLADEWSKVAKSYSDMLDSGHD
jgi:hypothetical protein